MLWIDDKKQHCIEICKGVIYRSLQKTVYTWERHLIVSNSFLRLKMQTTNSMDAVLSLSSRSTEHINQNFLNGGNYHGVLTKR